MLKIYGRRTSINVRKVLWCCEELAIRHEREDLGSGFRSPAAEEFLTLNPNGLVPVIDDGGFVLWQSNSIIRYLATAYGDHTLYSSDLRQHALIDQWIDWQATEFNDAWRGAFMGLVRKAPAYQDRRIIDESIAQWTKMMKVLEDRLHEAGAYVGGESFTLADIPIGLSIHRWFSTPVPHVELPAVEAYYNRLRSRPGFLAQLDEP